MRAVILLVLLSGCIVDVSDVDCSTDCGAKCDWSEDCIRRKCKPKKRELGCQEEAIPPDQQADPCRQGSTISGWSGFWRWGCPMQYAVLGIRHALRHLPCDGLFPEAAPSVRRVGNSDFYFVIAEGETLYIDEAAAWLCEPWPLKAPLSVAEELESATVGGIHE